MDIISRIKELVNELNKYCYEYYILDKPSISDKEYDEKYDKLLSLEKETNLILSNSPTQKVGYEVKSKLEKVSHSISLKSLDKTKDVEALKKFLGNREGILMLKLDGLTGRLDYDSELKLGATRGNGEIGEIITHNIKTFKNVPIKINGKLSISGECIITKDDFNKINEQLPQDEKYKTPRNLAAGSVRQLDNKICKNRNVKFYAFNILEGIENKVFLFKDQELNYLKSIGFDSVPFEVVNKNNLEFAIQELKEIAEKYHFPIDGLVLTYRDLEYGKTLGETSHHPLHSIAFKFYDEESETTLRDIEWSVGRTGNITPVAIFDTVELDGTEVGRASVHNLSILKQLKLGIGDRVSVYKANQIIPQLKENFTQSNNIIIPSECPECGGKTERKISEQAEVLVCINPNCNAKLVQSISHYCSKNAMNIVGLSEATIEKFIKEGFIKDVTDIYKLEQYKSKITKMEGFGVKSYNNLIKSIEDSKLCKLENFIFSLGIPNVGRGTSKDIANHFKTIDNFLEALGVKYNFTQIADIGDITTQSLWDWWTPLKNTEMVCKLLEYIEFKTEEKKEVSGNLPFTNMKIYCTGTFSNYKKDELKNIVERLGGEFASGYAKSLDMLVVGSLKGSSKEDKAKKDGVRVISENEFMEMIK